MSEGHFDDWEEVASVGQAYEAELIAARLEEAGIEAQVLDQSFEQIPVNNVTDFDLIRVLVPTAEAGKARQILSVPPSIPADAEATGTEPEVPVPSDEPPSKE
jgi:hypothetical protein